MADLLDRTRREIASRIDELKPRVEEHKRLEAALSALGIRDGSKTTRSARRRGPGRPARSATKATTNVAARVARKPRRMAKPGPGRRKGSGSRAAQASALVQSQPGLTIPQLAAKMGIKQNYLYRVLPALEKEGRVTKRGRGWHPKG
jgi:hypothetical protein